MYRVTITDDLDEDYSNILAIEFQTYEEARNYAITTISNSENWVRLDYIEEKEK